MGKIIGNCLLLTAALLLFGCRGPQPEALFLDAAAWSEDLERIALVELSFDRRYRPPPQSYLAQELRRALRQELVGKGYRLVVADRGEEIDRGETPATELIARAPAESDAALALHIDFLFIPTNWWERNPPPEVEIAGLARLVGKQNNRELWRGRGHGSAGGAAAMPVVYPAALRQEALSDFARGLFATLPNRP